MTLPVSSYEDLLLRVRNLTHETLQLRRELSYSLNEPPSVVRSNLMEGLQGSSVPMHSSYGYSHSSSQESVANRSGNSEFLNLGFQNLKISSELITKGYYNLNKENAGPEEVKEVDDRPSPDSCRPRGEWGPESLGLWHSGPSSLTFGKSIPQHQGTESVMSFSSSAGSIGGSTTGSELSRRAYSHQQLGAKVEMVYNLLSMLGTSDRDEMSRTLLAMSSSVESCQAMRQSGCLPLLIQLIHASELDLDVRARASEALHNMVHAQPDEKRRRREMRVLKFLQTVREHCDVLKTESARVPSEQHPGQAVAALMKYSFDADHRQAMCTLGGLHALAELIELEHLVHSSTTTDPLCVTLKRYAGMALTNLTFGDGANKALLCSLEPFMAALIAQLESSSDELRQVTASVIRNLSWRADPASKARLRDCRAVPALMVAAMRCNTDAGEVINEPTLKSVLSALWNLSAHCSMNKVDICSVPGALAFLVRTLRYKSATTLGIVENAGGILRNISSHIAVREDYRQILRDENCFDILLEQLKSPSLTVVSNACGTLWNLSARCAEDQRKLWDMGASTMLRSLVQSKHKMIAMGSSAALKNLLAANPNGSMLTQLDSTARGLGLKTLPSLTERKQRALEQELDVNLAETCDNVDATVPKRSDSRESVTSTHSDSVYERLARRSNTKLLEKKELTLHDSLSETGGNIERAVTESKLLRRCKTSMIPKPAGRKSDDDKSQKEVPAASTAKPRGIPVLKNRLKLQSQKSNSNVRNASFTDTSYPEEFEEDTTECPVNYSLQYSESEELKQNSKCTSNKDGMGRPFYAETDLDQPTDFSLKYGEDDDLGDQRLGYYDTNKEEDTTRTYYTEGTPYEGTPYTFSSANSMSDLRVVSCDNNEKNGELKAQQSASLSAEKPKLTPTGKIPCENTRSENYPPDKGNNISEFESGTSTPERPVQYCEEGTPAGCFSRFSSLSSLNGGKELNKQTLPDKPRQELDKDKEDTSTSKKLVTFGNTTAGVVTDTPLMFSRSSSIASLASCMANADADAANDADGSVVSAFSRLTSGLVSPSELPDSPTQTVPPSVIVKAMPQKVEEDHTKEGSNVRSVFDDVMLRYKQEDTPVEFSTRTSLSGIVSSADEASAQSFISEKYEDQKVPEIAESNCDEEKDRLELSSVSEVDESILADCISIGMGSADPKVRTRKISYHQQQISSEDTLQTYHTEDTPINISNIGSHSDLSLLTVPSGLSAIDDASSNSSENDAQIGLLNECIHSGMPQSKFVKSENIQKKPICKPNIGQLLRRKNSIYDEPPVQKLSKDSISARDEVITFATENSPCNFSTRSSLSDLTVNSGDSNSSAPFALHQRVVAVSPIRCVATRTTPTASPNSSNHLELVDDGATGVHATSVSEDTLVTARSRQPSLSSLSVESFDSCEPTPLEQALLEQCINSGMPHRETLSVKVQPNEAEEVDGTVAVAEGENAVNEIMTGSMGTHTWSDEVSSSQSIQDNASLEERLTGLKVLDDTPPRPEFLVGSPANTIQADAAIICRELRRIQELDLLQSISSEISISNPSYDSFLDADLLEEPNKNSEGHTLTFKLMRAKTDPPSIPSLGPLHPVADFDLENSMISVASIVSEVVESPTLEASDNETVNDEDDDNSSQKSLPFDEVAKPKKITPKERRRQTKDRYRTYTVEELTNKCKEENELLKSKPLTTVQRFELLVNANIVTRTLENALAEQEAEYSIDTETYVNEVNHQYHKISHKENEMKNFEPSDEEIDEESEHEVKGPRILKPGDKGYQVQTEDEGPGIRGRRKPLYSSPKKYSVESPSKILHNQPLTEGSKSPLNRGKIPPPLCREGTFTKDDKTTPKNEAPKIPRPLNKPAPLTSTSDPKASMSKQRPVSSIPHPGKSPSGATAVTAKRNSSANPNAGSNSGQKPSANAVAPTLKNSPSNQSLGKSSQKATCPSKPVQVTSTKSKTPKKEVTSKIASLWKKVEESKKKQKDTKDSRVWIGGTLSPSSANEASSSQETLIVEHVEVVDLHKTDEMKQNVVIEKEELVELNTGKIVRSTTFQGQSASTSSEFGRSKGDRYSADVSIPWEGSKRHLDGRNIVSAIVPPFNYNPPAKKSSDVKAKDAVRLSYQKITTV